jgi:hypothetical protein
VALVTCRGRIRNVDDTRLSSGEQEEFSPDILKISAEGAFRVPGKSGQILIRRTSIDRPDSPGGFSLDPGRISREKYMESTHDNDSVFGAGQLVTCRLEELRPHPSYTQHGLTVPAAQLSALVELGDLAFRERIVITQNRTIIDGYARVKLAQLKERPALPCIVYELTETEALQCLLQRHLQSSGWNAFTRGQLAMDLEPGLREKALSNQRTGGQNKGSSRLTEADKIDVRAKIAEAAHLSVGTISKVNQLLLAAIPELLQALRNGEVRIDRAYKWSKRSAEEQREALWRYQSERSIRKTIRNLLSPCRSKSALNPPEVLDLTQLLSALRSGKLGCTRVVTINIPGKAIFVTEELSRTLGSQEELVFTCATNNR